MRKAPLGYSMWRRFPAGAGPSRGERPLTRRHLSYQRHRRYLYRLYWVAAVEVVCGGRVYPSPSYSGNLVEVREGGGTLFELVVAWSLYPLGGASRSPAMVFSDESTAGGASAWAGGMLPLVAPSDWP